ncbi:phage major capsid protein [Pannonibacter sp. SL95]|uniref:phage major capsid protein n=1 Tax=Pannonibacter sp. SL95 TaxID=2995153 RepID=UPI002275D15A|nr:phage major capsid protein [Pannonibacter sp. SL95]MCY1708400.1 phage major capsid protein [Pannonibacter sp. SL95]
MPTKRELELRSQLDRTWDEIKALNAKAALDPADEQRFNTLQGEVIDLDDKLNREKRVAEIMRKDERGERVDGGAFGRDLRSYKVANLVQGAASGRPTGFEGEVSDDLKRGRESRSGEAGIHVAIPVEVLLPETRSQTVGTPSAGGFMVPTTIAAVADRFRPALKVEQMGATVLRNLTGFLELPNLASSGSASWVAENGNAARSAAAFEKVSMGPKTITAEYRLSRRLLLQSGQAIEDILRRDLGFLLAQGLDSAAIAGTGTGAEPRGLLATSGVAKVNTETAFSDTTANLMAELERDDVTGTTAFLTHPNVMRMARGLKDGDGHVMPMGELFHGGRVETSTQVPNDLGAGNDKSALIYGQWSELYVGYWSAVDILLNPYHPDVASNGGVLMHVFLDVDVAVRHPEAFAYAEV